MKSDAKRLVLAFSFYGAWFFGSFGFIAMVMSFFSDDTIYMWWAMGSAIVASILIAVILIEILYDALDGDR